jgi:hypothetical protein
MKTEESSKVSFSFPIIASHPIIIIIIRLQVSSPTLTLQHIRDMMDGVREQSKYVS